MEIANGPIALPTVPPSSPHTAYVTCFPSHIPVEFNAGVPVVNVVSIGRGILILKVHTSSKRF
eukprot:6369416-Amphidinium_carterae.1